MQDWLAARAAARPTGLALITHDERLDFAAMHRQVSALAGSLAEAGVQPGQHVAMLLPTRRMAVLAVFAVARLGAVLVPLNSRLTDDQLRAQLSHADAAWLLADATTAERARSLGVATLPVDSLAAAGTPIAHGEVNLNALLAIVFTSGTSGTPKGVMLSVGNLFWGATASAWRLGVQPNDRWLSGLPLYHVGGLAVLWRSVLYGTTVVLRERFEPDAWARDLRRHAITLVSLVPTMLHRLLPVVGDWHALPHLRCVLLGGAAAPPALLAAALGAGVPVATTYGLTEAASQVATLAPAEMPAKPGSVGRPLMFTSVRVVDEAGKPCPPDTLGEVWVQGPTVMQGYYRQPEATAAVLRDGWLRTGDLGHLDADGDLWISTRRSDLIVTGGENVVPQAVEDVLLAHSAVREVCVVGLPNAEWGQRVAALVVADRAVTTGALEQHARQHLAGYQVPRVWAFARALPRTASGKVQRPEVIRLLEDASGA